jgi:cystathionine beta-lyase/cystathionine gamma-synthase
VASWLATHPRVDRVHFSGDPAHPDASTIQRLFPKNLYGAMIAFELKGAGRAEVFQFMERLKMIVRATSMGDVHTMALYPAIASHRDLSPKQRQRLGIGDNLVRISTGIEAADDIIGDLDQALKES